MPGEYTIQRLRGGFSIVYFDAAGKRHRYSLETDNAGEAKRRAPAIFAELTRPQGKTVSELWAGYVADKAGRAVIGTMQHTWKALAERFGRIPGDCITVQDCRAHVADRRAAGIKDWTIITELGHLRSVLSWAVKHSYLSKASYIERPSTPRQIERHLTREETRALIRAASYAHVKLYLILLVGTAARTTALLQLQWIRCDFDRGLIDLRNPDIRQPHKGRAIVPMNRGVRAALLDAHATAIGPHVIEWAGKPVASVRKGLQATARAAGVRRVSPHMLRHSAAVHMAEDGIAMDEIAQFLGHSDVSVTRKTYARYSPDYLRKAAESLNYDDLGSMNLSTLPSRKLSD